MKKTIEIPEIYEVIIEGKKVILEPEVSKNERIRKQLLNWFKDCHWDAIDEDKTPLKRNDIIAWLEKQGSQNLAKPEFKVGDWVVYDGWVTQILQVCQDGYINIHHGFIPKEREKIMRLLTIVDM